GLIRAKAASWRVSIKSTVGSILSWARRPRCSQGRGTGRRALAAYAGGNYDARGDRGQVQSGAGTEGHATRRTAGPSHGQRIGSPIEARSRSGLSRLDVLGFVELASRAHLRGSLV